MAGAVLASRWPTITFRTELNPDEGQLLAQAMRLRLDPVPWRGMDGTTGGPLDSWLPYLAHALGMPLDYTGAHVLAAILLVAMVALTWAALRLTLGRAAAAAGGAQATLFVVLAQNGNFTHLSSELVPALLTSLAMLCIAARLARPRWGFALDLATGLLLGLVPWAKLQAVPGALVLGLWTVWRLLAGHDPGAAPRAARIRAGAFVAAMALPSVAVLAIVAIAGAWQDFRASYVLGNAAYVAGSSLLEIARKLVLFESTASAVRLSGVLWLALCWLWLGRPGWRRAGEPGRAFLSAVALLAAASGLSVFTPRVPFVHYQVLLLQPMALLGGALVAMWVRDDAPPAARRHAAALIVVCTFGFALATVGPAITEARTVLAARADADRTPARRIAREVIRLCPDARTMAVWGWMPSVHVETGIPPATRHAIGHFVIEPSRGRERLRASYLADVRRRPPDVIVDAVADGCFTWGWGPAQRLASFPELDAFVARHYVRAGELDLTGGGQPVRFYVSRAYLARRARMRRPTG